MKTSLFLIISILIILSLYLSIPSRAQSQAVAVSAIVLEHLTYQSKGQKLIISTNSPVGFSLITPKKTLQFFQPTEQSLNLLENFILVVNF